MDAVRDPNPDKAKAMTARKKGPDIKGPPIVSRSLGTRIRAWQVKPELLEDNSHWMGRRVTTNGIAWGDAEDPVEEKPTGKKQGKGDEEGVPKKRRRLVSANGVAASEQAVEKLLGGDDMESLFSLT